jgi:hypothetical protein
MKFDPLKNLFKNNDFFGCLAKWVMLLIEFDLKFFSQKEIKEQALTDQLANSPSPWALPNDDSFHNESVLTTDTKP